MGLTKILTAGALLVGVTGVAGADTFTYQLRPSDGLTRGTELLQTGNLEDARRYYFEVLSENPTPRQQASAYNGLCISHILGKEWVEALEHCNSAVRTDPANWRYYNNRGNIYLEVGDFAKAREEYEHALDLAPNSITVRQNLELTEVRESAASARGQAVERPV